MFDSIIENNLILLRKITWADFEDLFSIAKNKIIWEHYPNKEIYKKKYFSLFFEEAIRCENCYIILLKENNQIIGSTRFYIGEKNKLIIGYTFLNPKYWGKKINFEVKKLMINHAFEFFNQVNFVIASTNIRSLKAVEKIGAVKTNKLKKTYSNKVSLECFYYTIFKEGWSY